MRLKPSRRPATLSVFGPISDVDERLSFLEAIIEVSIVMAGVRFRFLERFVKHFNTRVFVGQEFKAIAQCPSARRCQAGGLVAGLDFHFGDSLYGFPFPQPFRCPTPIPDRGS